MYSQVALLSIALAAFIGQSVDAGESSCVPDKTGFYYAPCPKYARQSKIYVKKIRATQDGKSLDSQGGIDLTKPLTLNFTIKFNYGKVIKYHRFDQKVYQYAQKEDGACDWDEMNTQGLTDDMDACPLIKSPDCQYVDNPTTVVSEINFPELFGEGISAMDVGKYYAFETHERDGNQLINCIWMQAKVIKNS